MNTRIPNLYLVGLLILLWPGQTGAAPTRHPFGYLIRDQVHYVSLGHLSRFYHFSVAKTPDRFILNWDGREMHVVSGNVNAWLDGQTLRMRLPPFQTGAELFVPVGVWVDLMPQFVGSRFKGLIHVSPVIRSIIIDPGHGGKDSGAVAGGIQEKDLNLTLSRHLMEALNRRGFQTRLTRYSDRFISIEERVLMAEHFKADLLISIHGNSSKFPSARGVETYTLSSLSRHSRRNSTIQAYPVENYYYDYIQKNYMQVTRDLSHVFLNSFQIFPGYRSRGLKHSDFRILRLSHCPAIMIETGFLTNERDAVILSRPANLLQLAERLAEGILRYNRDQHRHLDV